MLPRLSALRRLLTIRPRSQTRSRRRRRLWVLDGLEDRVLLSGPTAYTVHLTTDSGTGSGNTGDIRYVIDQANADPNPAGSKITFDIPTSDPGYHAATGSWTITLSSTLELSEMAGTEVIQALGPTW